MSVRVKTGCNQVNPVENSPWYPWWNLTIFLSVAHVWTGSAGNSCCYPDSQEEIEGSDSWTAAVWRFCPRLPVCSGLGSLPLAGVSRWCGFDWQLSCGRWRSRAREAEPSGYGSVIAAASFPWISALLQLHWHKKGGGKLGPVLGCTTLLSKSDLKPPSPSPVFCYPSPHVGARWVCCSKPGLTNMIFSLCLAVASRQLLSGPEANGIVLLEEYCQLCQDSSPVG